MKKFILALVLLACSAFALADYASDPRFPAFERFGIKFQCTFQEDFASINVLYWNGNVWRSWGGPAETNGEVGYVYDDAILSHGSLRNYMAWAASECERRAEAFAALPLPNPSDRIDRFRYALKMLLKVQDGHIIVPAGPLP